MKILVCVKIIEGELNPFDECALEEALRIENAEVSVLSMCPLSCREKLQSLTRLGVKNVTLISDRVFAGSDTLATSYILSKQVEKTEYDLIFCGRQTIDGDTAQVGPCLSALLGINLITNVMGIEKLTDTEISCHTRMGDETVTLPALLTVERINTLRFPSIRSKLGEITVVDNATVGADVSRCGFDGSPTKVLKTFENSSGFRHCRFIEAKDFRSVFDALPRGREENVATASPVKLPLVWAVGETVLPKAQAIAEKTRLITEKDPRAIVEMIQKEKPAVVLWNADLWGRKNAPIVSALLETGLCADCTALETDGEKLFMYRPARSGNIIAKIECRTLPQMATVRCAEKSDDVIVSGGRGIADQIDSLAAFAGGLHADLCASRALVDKNLMPYETQVGLTGRTVTPRVYIAVGISGAVQHTCAIENAQTVIAINPDKDAPIFRSADYGIVSTFENFLKEI